MLKSMIIYATLFGLLAAESLAGQQWAGNVTQLLLWLMILLMLFCSLLWMVARAHGITDLPKIPLKKSNIVWRAVFWSFLICLAASGHVFTCLMFICSYFLYKAAGHSAGAFQSEEKDA